MKRRILFLTLYDERGASSRLTIYQYLSFFEKAGFETAVRPLIQCNPYKILDAFAQVSSPFKILPTLALIAFFYLKRFIHIFEARNYDIVLVQKDVLPFGLAPALRFFQKNIVFECDDPIWLSHESSGSKIPFIGKWIGKYRKALFDRILTLSRLVIVDNLKMKEYAKPLATKVEVLDASVNPKDYAVEKLKTSTELAVGWIGSPSTSYLLRELIPSLERVSEKLPLKLYNVGGEAISSEKLKVKNLPWSLENEKLCLSKIHVGLMPMDLGEFSAYRTSRKWLIYGSAAIPTIAASTELNRLTLKDGVTAVLYEMQNPDDFCAKLTALLQNESLRNQIGNEVYRKIESELTVSKVGEKFVSLVQSV